MKMSVNNSAAERDDGKKFATSDGRDVIPEVKAKLGTFGRIWKTVSRMVKEMTHPLTIFSPDQVVTTGGFKRVRIPPSVEDCNQHRDAYSARMGDVKMEWQDFENTAAEVKTDAGAQLVQFKALPVGLEKKVLEEIVIQKGFIVIAWTLER